MLRPSSERKKEKKRSTESLAFDFRLIDVAAAAERRMGMEKQAGMKALVRPSLNPCPRQKLREYRLYLPRDVDSVVVGFGLSAERDSSGIQHFTPASFPQIRGSRPSTTSFRSLRILGVQGRLKYPQLSR